MIWHYMDTSLSKLPSRSISWLCMAWWCLVFPPGTSVGLANDSYRYSCSCSCIFHLMWQDSHGTINLEHRDNGSCPLGELLLPSLLCSVNGSGCGLQNFGQVSLFPRSRTCLWLCQVERSSRNWILQLLLNKLSREMSLEMHQSKLLGLI